MDIVVPINNAAVVVAALSGIVLGSLWYGPLLGKQWIALMKITPQQVEEAKKKGMGKSYALAFLGSLLMSYVLAHALVFASAYMKSSGFSAGLMTAFWNWLGFIVPVTLGSVLWEGRSWKLWTINTAYYLVELGVMGVILALWR
jgi:hypothetical protein